MSTVVKTSDLNSSTPDSFFKVRDMPYPELFDRSGRTFAATFAKFGDL